MKGRTLILYHKPYCPYCRELYPVWRKVTRTVNQLFKGVKVKAVDCAKRPEAQREAKVSTVPTIKFTTGKGAKVYRGKREHDAVIKWLAKSNQST